MKRNALVTALFLLLSCALFGQINTAPFPNPVPQFFDANGAPLSGGRLLSFSAGTTTPLATYTDATGLVQNTNPVVMNASGFPANSSGSIVGIWLGAQKYKFVLQDSLGVQLWSIDQVGGNNLFSLANLNMAESTAPTCNVGFDILWGDSAGHRFKFCNNGGAQDFLVGQNTIDTLYSKTLISPVLTSPSVSAGTYSGTETHSGTETFSGTTTVKNLNTIQMADQQTGATADLQIAACIAALPASGGICDARGYGSTSQTLAAQLSIGSVTKTVTLLLDRATRFNINFGGGVDAIQIAEGSAVSAEGVSTRNTGFNVGSSANLQSIFSNADKTGAAAHLHIKGVTVTVDPAATISKGVFYIVSLFGDSGIENVEASGFTNSCGILLTNNINGAGLGPFHLRNNWINAVAAAGATPLCIKEAGVGGGLMAGIDVFGGLYEHAGAGLPQILIQGSAQNALQGVDIDTHYTEINSATGVGVKIDGGSNIRINNLTFGNGGTQGQDCIQITNGSGGTATGILMTGIENFNGCTTNLINDQVHTILSTGVRKPIYIYPSSVPLSNLSDIPAEISVESATQAAVSGASVCYTDSTSHTRKCAYNNGSFFSMTQTIGTGTSTSNGTAILNGVSQAQPAITITGAAVTDVATCSLNAAPVATWQTGIQLLPAIVTANTVTPWLGNPTAGSITPAAAVIRCTVIR